MHMQIQSQNFYHRQSTSLMYRQMELRKVPSQAHIVMLPARRSQQTVQERELSPGKMHPSPVSNKFSVSQDLKKRVQTLESSPYTKFEDQWQSKIKTIQANLKDKQGSKMDITKTTTIESVDEERTPPQRRVYLQLQQQLFEKDMKIVKLERENHSLKQIQNKLLLLQHEYDVIRKENEILRKKVLDTERDTSVYESALTEQDLKKIQSLVFCDGL